MSTAEWKAEVDSRLHQLETSRTELINRVDALEKLNTTMKEALAHNTRVTEETNVKICEVVDKLGLLIVVINNSRVMARLVKWCASALTKAINKVARWMLPIATLIAVVWGFIEALRRSK